MNRNLDDLQQKIGVNFKDIKILEQALTHRSYLNEAKSKGLVSNERMEFLGDSILAFWVSSQVFTKFPDLPEGKLTFIRTHLVRTETLTSLSRKLGVGEFFFMSNGEELGGGRDNPLLLANAFEAIIGAIYLDQGVEAVSQFLKKELGPLIEKVSDPDLLKDSKSLLQEEIQSQGSSSPTYNLISASGPDHQRFFVMGVYQDGKLISEGTGKTKQEAEEAAAKKALEIVAKKV